LGSADAFRDRGEWLQANALYRRVVEKEPKLAPIWVQLGHTYKEAGDLANAELAYRKAIEVNQWLADAYLQLGHVLKLRGNRAEAVNNYAHALELQPTMGAALRELKAAGKYALVSRVRNSEADEFGMLHETLADLRRLVGRVEGILPDIQSLSCVSADDFSLFRRRFRLSPPPLLKKVPNWSVVVLDNSSRSEDIVATCRSINDQTIDVRRVDVVTNQPGVAVDLQQVSNVGLADRLTVHHDIGAWEAGESEWCLVVKAGGILFPEALAWLSWATEHSKGECFYSDEELLDESADDASTSRAYLKGCYDPEVSLFSHGMLAFRVDAMTRAGEPRALFASLEAAAVLVALHGIVGHLPRVLLRRRSERHQTKQLNVGGSFRSRGKQQISLIVPTRDGLEDLQKCLTAARSLDDSQSTQLIIVDNGSQTEEMAKYLADQAGIANTKVVRNDEPFNWSRLNNVGVKHADGEILLFINDDVEITTAGWDDALRRGLENTEHGAIGARLNYPDGSIQHAGILLGVDSHTGHEGQGAVTDEILHRWRTRHVVSAVTGAFLACRRVDFERVGGLDEICLPIWFNDVDFNLKLRSLGLRIVYDPEITGIHYESKTLKRTPTSKRRHEIWREGLATMKARWGLHFEFDPGFNPHFLRSGTPFEAIIEPSFSVIARYLEVTSVHNPWLVSKMR
jgi:GT2 family glycosyltransferase